MGFLDDLRVVDATRLLPGAFCTMILSDMGAQVTKVEEPGIGDYMRASPPTVCGVSPLHETVNRNKLSVGINLKDPEGKEVLRRLLSKADVFVEGFRPGAMKRLGFSFQEVKKLNPGIIYCSISSYGQTSPLSSMPAHDINFEAMAGTMGYSDTPQIPLLQAGDVASGCYAATAILGALAGRKRGVHLDVPIVPSLLSMMVVGASAYLATGTSPREGHSMVFGSTPYYNVYETSDRKHLAVAAIEERFWHNLVTALGVPHLEEKRFGTRGERTEVSRTLKRVFASKTRDEWSQLLMDTDTCVTPVLSLDEALESAWAREAEMLVRVGKGRVLNGPVKSSTPLRSGSFTKAPSLGRDTYKVLAPLGYTRARVKRLKQTGAVE